MFADIDGAFVAGFAAADHSTQELGMLDAALCASAERCLRVLSVHTDRSSWTAIRCVMGHVKDVFIRGGVFALPLLQRFPCGDLKERAPMVFLRLSYIFRWGTSDKAVYLAAHQLYEDFCRFGVDVPRLDPEQLACMQEEMLGPMTGADM